MTSAQTREYRCRICGNTSGNKTHLVREMMFGSQESFEYFECVACGAIQIAEIPENLGRYYQGEYYSFKNFAREQYSPLQGFLKRARARYAMEGRGFLGALVARVKGTWPYFAWFKAAKVSFDNSILDVGCGRGDYLLRFASDGFKHLTGCDPFLESDIQFKNGVNLYRRTMEEMTGEFDCIFSRHSLEHVPDPPAAVKQMARLAKPGGAVLIAVPIAQCWAWHEYGVHWFQLDAPRHIVIPSKKSMELLARHAGLTLENVLSDSSDLQMIASELYRRGISLSEYHKNGPAAYFTPQQLAAFKKKTAELNLSGEGDQVCFILRKDMP